MRKIIIKKQEAPALAEFLLKVELKNKISRLRNKFNKKLTEISEETEAERIELCKEHADKDEKGEAIVNDGKYQVADFEALNKDILDLYEEQVAVEVGEYSSNFQPLFEYLDSEAFDMTLSGSDANCYDRLLDIWEAAQEEKEEEK